VRRAESLEGAGFDEVESFDVERLRARQKIVERAKRPLFENRTCGRAGQLAHLAEPHPQGAPIRVEHKYLAAVVDVRRAHAQPEPARFAHVDGQPVEPT
jgi:hypothetical protein